MSLMVIGAGLGRTGTHSLKVALEILLQAPCYHMLEVFQRSQDLSIWSAASAGKMPDWPVFLQGYRATVDWPGSSFWKELRRAFPEARVLLSTRRSSEEWFASASKTIFEVVRTPTEPGSLRESQFQMIRDLWSRTFCPHWWEEVPARQAYERHNEEVRRNVPASHLIEWQPGQGWGPICQALQRTVPEQDFPHLNSTAEFRRMMGMDGNGG